MSESLIPISILVIDDEREIEPLFQLRFRKKILAGEIKFIYAFSGKEALQLLAGNRMIDIVLCDINMPEIDGLTLLPKLLKLNELLRVIIVSAYGNMGNIRKAMNLGAFDFVNKPIDFKDLKLTIDKTIKELSILKKARLTKELEQQNKRLIELDETKSNFFTSISHEFRTPLTSIIGVTEQMELDPEKWFKRGVNIIKQDSNYLLNLTNQVLELQQLDFNGISLKLIQKDIASYIYHVTDRYYPLLERKNIDLKIQSSVSELVMDFDPDKINTIVSNLLSNAYKYTPKDGSVTIELDQVDGYFQIKVEDNGNGIPKEELPLIFDRFYRVSSIENEDGNGVGLSITKEFVELMGGTIHAISELNKGTIFKVKLPLKKQTPLNTSEKTDSETSKLYKPPSLLLSKSSIPNSNVRPTILIVEDNVEIVLYLKACLENQYLIKIAWNGQEGINNAIENIPDLIISDLKLPFKSGYDLCQLLKNDHRTSHIPIILLTANTNQNAKLEGLKKGADVYLNKPFDRKELLVRIDQLLKLREKLQQHYRDTDKLSNWEANTQNLEDDFLWKVRQAIEENMSNEHFGISDLCQKIGTSRTQLHRKLKALTGLSASLYIRSIRLEKAKVLLQTTDLNVSQVAFMVGFVDPKYFSTKFREHFGHKPSDYKKREILNS